MKLEANITSLKEIPYSITLGSMLLAFFIDIRAINWTLIYGHFIHMEGLMVILYLLSIILILMVIPFQKKWAGNRPINGASLFILFYLFVSYILTQTFIGVPYTPLTMFGVATLCAFIIPQLLVINVPIFLKTTMALPFFAIFRLNSVFSSVVDWDMQVSMDTSYAFLVPIVANIVYLAFYFKKEKGFIQKGLTVLLTLINFVFLTYILLYGSRGPFLCIVTLLLWLYISKFRNNRFYINRKRFLYLVIGALLFILSGIVLLSKINSFLVSIGIEIDAFSKTIELSKQGNISNGRSTINEVVINAIMQRPVFGWGIDRFDANTGMAYPHNFIFQILYDGGLSLFLVLILPVYFSLKKKMMKMDVDQYAYLSTVFFASVPGALFSQNLWMIPVLWVCFGAIQSAYIYKLSDSHSHNSLI